MQRLTSAILLVVLLAGCAGAPVGWGGKQKTLLANERAIMINYDPIVCNLQEVTQAADDHCARYGRSAVPIGYSESGATPVANFRCE